MTKKLMVLFVMMIGLAVLMTGCQKTEEPKDAAATVEKKADAAQPPAAQPDKAVPKDHPAH